MTDKLHSFLGLAHYRAEVPHAKCVGATDGGFSIQAEDWDDGSKFSSASNLWSERRLSNSGLVLTKPGISFRSSKVFTRNCSACSLCPRPLWTRAKAYGELQSFSDCCFSWPKTFKPCRRLPETP